MAVKVHKVVLVDTDDRVVGEMEKMQAHKKARLHRAVSVFIVNSRKEWLLQRRAAEKYHSAGLWSNTSCTHPLMDEENEICAKRRLKEEMGIDAELQYVFNFIYRTELNNALYEHELDHVYIGMTDEKPKVNPDEVSEWKYISYDELKADLNVHPENYTAWFKKMHNKVYRLLDDEFKND